jgi:hypothetical protein
MSPLHVLNRDCDKLLSATPVSLDIALVGMSDADKTINLLMEASDYSRRLRG